jgi:hypothetical protein
MTKTGKSPKRASKLMAAVGTLGVSLGMTVWTVPVDGAGPATAASEDSQQVKHNAIKWGAGSMSNHKEESRSSIKWGAQNSYKEQNSIKVHDQHAIKFWQPQNSHKHQKAGSQNFFKKNAGPQNSVKGESGPQ